MTDDATRVWQALRLLVLERNDRRREVCRALDLSFVKIKALLHIAEKPLSLSALAAVLLTDAPYTSVIVSDLERRGFLTRAPNPDDGRSKLVSVTAAGRRVARSAETILNVLLPALRALSTRDLVTLDRITSTLLDGHVER